MIIICNIVATMRCGFLVQVKYDQLGKTVPKAVNVTRLFAFARGLWGVKRHFLGVVKVNENAGKYGPLSLTVSMPWHSDYLLSLRPKPLYCAEALSKGST